MKKSIRIFLLLSLVGLWTTDIVAQAPQETPAETLPEAASNATSVPDAAPPATKREGRARFFDPEDGQLDMSYFLENPRGFLPIPLVVTEPAVGYGGGMAGMFLRPRPQAGSEGWARPDISALGVFGTQNDTWGAFAGDASLWLGGRLKTLAGAGTGRANLDFYTLGAGGPTFEQKVRYSLEFAGTVLQGSWQVAPRSPWWIGLRYVYAEVEPTLRDEPAFPGLVDAIRFKVSAPTAILEFDTRDNVFTPTRGIYAETTYLVSREQLGSSDDFERFQQVLMGWYPLARKVTLGGRANYAKSSGETPFFLRPFVQLRGVPAVRWQGDEVTSVEVEGRWQFHGRWSAVAFAGAGKTRTIGDGSSSRDDVTSGGLGFRYELARKFGLHAGMDVAQSGGTTAVYFQIGNAWFRP